MIKTSTEVTEQQARSCFRWKWLPLLWFVCVPSQALAADAVLQQQKIEKAVSFLYEVLDDGVIEGELINATPQRVSNIEVLVRYSWIWLQESRESRDDPSWSSTFTFPVELDPGETSPLSIPPIHPVAERDDGFFRISAKVMGYTRYRWVNEPEFDTE